MNETRALMAAVVLGISSTLAPAAVAAGRDGKTVVDQTCIVCHGSGLEGAPRIGDEKAWGARSERGLSALTSTALEGVRRMPPHGGKLSIDDLELKRAITYMVNQSGGKWSEPIDRAKPPAARTGAAIVEARCAACHATGLHGSPRLGDRDAWIERGKRGFDSLVRSAIAGHGGMQARGGMADLTDPEMKAAVEHMVRASIKPKPPAAK